MDFTECYVDTVSSVAAAARVGCRRRLRRLIREGRSVDCPDNRGWTALHEAAASGSVGCLKEILSAASVTGGSSWDIRSFVNSATHEGESACHLAARCGCLPAVRILVRAGADVNQCTNDLSCPLYAGKTAAVSGDHKDVVQLLLAKGAEVNGTHTASCWTCLHQAVYQGHTAVVRILARVADLEARDDNRVTPLFLAAQYGRRECLKVLVDAGADVNAQAADLATPLLLASQEGHTACVDVLLGHGADPNIACSQEWPQLPIHAAAQFGHREILRRLIPLTERACDRGEGMVSPLYLAAEADQEESARLLLSEGFSPDGQDCTRLLGFRSPLHAALQSDALVPPTKVTTVLLEAGARLSEDEWGHVLRPSNMPLLEAVLFLRPIPPPWQPSDDSAGARHRRHMALRRQELGDMLAVALRHIQDARYWLPRLLKAGLEPASLLQPCMLENAASDVVNYLLHFANWSTLSTSLKVILCGRRAEETWRPDPLFDSTPSLAHLCRLRVRLLMGPHLVTGTDRVRQLPVPPRLHLFLRFRDIPEPSVQVDV
uniref:ankyrin repeat and SOCS box protein 3 isoform X2 n=1 Tax=Doryrhamphus excisus TaxID=161450 RepID=UPI0025AE61E5|nr:ankyrin repeat and SOCS box protein 3 isoform X2 [Doryrhamphus excisus]